MQILTKKNIDYFCVKTGTDSNGKNVYKVDGDYDICVSQDFVKDNELTISFEGFIRRFSVYGLDLYNANGFPKDIEVLDIRNNVKLCNFPVPKEKIFIHNTPVQKSLRAIIDYAIIIEIKRCEGDIKYCSVQNEQYETRDVATADFCMFFKDAL